MSRRPVTVLIAALGGEGGGVLANWVMSAAARHGLCAQSTSIPGVAQRTGATTYYLEIMPVPTAELGGRRPVLALLPGIGDIDILLASELVEASRAVGAGFVTPQRTLVIASTSRTLVMEEKMAMGDGRLDADHLMQAIARHAREAQLLDLDTLARRSGAIVNAVMLGAIAGCGRLPIPPEAFEAAIREDGKAVDANLRGFSAGLDAVRRHVAPGRRADEAQGKRPSQATALSLERRADTLPEAARALAVEGVRRLVGYQGTDYAQLYLDRLEAVRLADAAAGAGGRLVAATARHLAVRMSFEDVIRVARAKIDPARFRRIADEMRIGPGTPYAVTEFLKPGIEEVCAVLPPGLARPILRLSARRGWRVHWGMEINTMSVTGYLRFWLLARLRRWRPHGHRFHEEQQGIEGWLALIVDAAARAPELAVEVAECARLIKGYGDTYRRGAQNYRLIEERLIRPVLAGRIAVAHAVDAIASARTAALVDAEGESLARCLAEFERQAGQPLAAE